MIPTLLLRPKKQRGNLNNLQTQLVQTGVPNFPFIELLDFASAVSPEQ